MGDHFDGRWGRVGVQEGKIEKEHPAHAEKAVDGPYKESRPNEVCHAKIPVNMICIEQTRGEVSTWG